MPKLEIAVNRYLIFAVNTPATMNAAAQVATVYGIARIGNRVFSAQISAIGVAIKATTAKVRIAINLVLDM
jgi:hypothetical protein